MTSFQSRRQFIAGGLGALASSALTARSAEAAGLSLAVFLHVDVKLRYFQSLLRDALPGVDVTAYGRFGDATRAIEAGAHALLALRPVLDYQGLSVTLSGQTGNRTDEPYVLVANGRKVDPSSVTRVGVVDLLGRRGTRQWVWRLLKSNPQVNRVTKFEDLLPMLQLEMADAVLVPEDLAAQFKQKSRLPLQVTPVPTRVGLAAVGVLRPGGERIPPMVSRVNANLKRIMRVEGWE